MIRKSNVLVVDSNIDDLIELISEWRTAFKDDINENYTGKPLTDINIIVPLLKSIIGDLRSILEYEEALARRIKDLTK